MFDPFHRRCEYCDYLLIYLPKSWLIDCGSRRWIAAANFHFVGLFFFVLSRFFCVCVCEWKMWLFPCFLKKYFSKSGIFASVNNVSVIHLLVWVERKGRISTPDLNEEILFLPLSKKLVSNDIVLFLSLMIRFPNSRFNLRSKCWDPRRFHFKQFLSTLISYWVKLVANIQIWLNCFWNWLENWFHFG